MYLLELSRLFFCLFVFFLFCFLISIFVQHMNICEGRSWNFVSDQINKKKKKGITILSRRSGLTNPVRFKFASHDFETLSGMRALP